ncbi:14986_t:CDS:2 [Funneliformis mosseae]|uniref:14986_t:CDS:1 n=1 Tax=Funneliformis mosseae TaxID=27381 RepID=A0A9N9AQ85_FUNMO|nr:14986_t:CDS:2 [Funneliformis mosseae]
MEKLRVGTRRRCEIQVESFMYNNNYKSFLGKEAMRILVVKHETRLFESTTGKLIEQNTEWRVNGRVEE